jgi:hypothetical protein
MAGRAPGFFDIDDRLVELPAKGDGFERVNTLVDFEAGAPALALLTFIGGLSAATGMLIVPTVSLSTMLCNDVIMPFFLQKVDKTNDVTKLPRVIRRCLVFLILLFAFAIRWLIDEKVSLAQYGLLSFAAIAQLGPAFWRPRLAGGESNGRACRNVRWLRGLAVYVAHSGDGVGAPYSATVSR